MRKILLTFALVAFMAPQSASAVNQDKSRQATINGAATLKEIVKSIGELAYEQRRANDIEVFRLICRYNGRISRANQYKRHCSEIIETIINETLR